MTHQEKCEFWARIYELPHASTVQHRDGTSRQAMNPASEVALFVAEALRFYGEHGVNPELTREDRQGKKAPLISE